MEHVVGLRLDEQAPKYPTDPGGGVSDGEASLTMTTRLPATCLNAAGEKGISPSSRRRGLEHSQRG